MTEHPPSPEPHERQEDPELRAISERFGVVIDVLGFEETGEIGEARTALVSAVRSATEGFDWDNPKHTALFDAYQNNVARTLPDHPELEYSAGYQVALLRLWLDCADENMFYRQFDFNGDRGVYEFLRHRRGFDACLTELIAIIDDLEAYTDGEEQSLPGDGKARL